MHYDFSIPFMIVTMFTHGICKNRNHDSQFHKIANHRPKQTGTYRLIHHNDTITRHGSDTISKHNESEIMNKNHEPTISITTDCLKKCGSDPICLNVVIFYDSLRCYTYDYLNERYGVDFHVEASTAMDQNSSKVRDILNLVRDNNASFFIKIWTPAAPYCQSKLWTVEIIPNGNLVTKPALTQTTLFTRQKCVELCVSETRFPCLSANFVPKESGPRGSNGIEIYGQCQLNDANRHTRPNSFVFSNDYGLNEYIENVCYNLSSSNKDICPFSESLDKFLKKADKVFEKTTLEQCESQCKMDTTFNCLAFSLVPPSFSPAIYDAYQMSLKLYTCLLHSDDALLGNALITDMVGAKYFERSKCLNLSLSCDLDKMTISYTPEQKFSGRIYMSGYSNVAQCNSFGRDDRGQVLLQIQLSTFQCGLIQAKSIGYHNRTLLSGSLIIQYNQLIQTLGDRLIRLGCLIDDNYNKVPESVTLATKVIFHSGVSDDGSILINNSTVTPIVQLLIFDPYFENKVTYDVQVGQPIKLVIDLQPPNGPYDIWAGHLMAISENKNESLLLLDDKGCPTNSAIFPGLKTDQTASRKQLYAQFPAFKFASSPIVKFTVIVHFCVMNCTRANCDRTRREINSTDLSDQKGGVAASVHLLDRNMSSQDAPIALPLQYVIYVHNKNLMDADRLVLTDGARIPLAAFDLEHNEICLDYTILIAIIVMWIVLQVIIFIGCALTLRYYKRAYEEARYERQSLSDMSCSSTNAFNLAAFDRRVHWADQQLCPHVILH